MWNLTDRKKQILKVSDRGLHPHCRTGGLQDHRREMGGKISSATIRNELADLVELGYLEQPHTSAGRSPLPKATASMSTS